MKKHMRFNNTALLFMAWVTLAGMLSSCVMPKTVQNSGSNCGMVTKELTLEVLEYPGVYCYRHDDCLAAATMLLASTAVSGSIVVIGNSVHWLEKQSRCSKDEETSTDRPGETASCGALATEKAAQ